MFRKVLAYLHEKEVFMFMFILHLSLALALFTTGHPAKEYAIAYVSSVFWIALDRIVDNPNRKDDLK